MCSLSGKLWLMTLLCVMTACITGCLGGRFSSRSLGNTGNKHEQPFYGLQNIVCTLKRPVDVVYHPEIADRPDSAEFFVRTSIVLPPKDREKYPKQLPVGTPICFNHNSFRVTRYFVFHILYKVCYEANFHIQGNPPDERYYYLWGRGRRIHRAPWEDEDTPEWRYVGFNGKSYRPKEKPVVE